MNIQRMFHLIILSLALFIMIGMNRLQVSAQESLTWVEPHRIPGYDSSADVPFLIADQNRTIHAFNSVWLGGERAIVYSQWILGQGWTKPIDIILPQIANENRLKSAFLDDKDMVHLVFFSGDEIRSNIYHTKAPLIHAGNVSAWSTPEVIGEAPLIPDVAAGVSDNNGRLLVLFGGTKEGHGLYFTYSLDNGDTWSKPSPFFLTYSDELWPTNLKMYVDNHQNTHAVWAVANETGNSETLHYKKLENDQLEWAELLVLANATNGVVDTPSIIEYEDTLFVIYHDDWPTTRHMLQSIDGGQSWSEKVRLFPHVGSNGPASLVVDNNGVLHMFFGNRLSGSPDIHGLWHTTWLGTAWSTPKAIVSGPTIQDLEGNGGFDPSFANGIISQGNVFLITWRTDPQAGVNGAWYSYEKLDAPELPINPLLVPTLSTIVTPMPSPTITSSFPLSDTSLEDHTMTNYQNDLPPTNMDSPAKPIILGILPTLFIIVIVVMIVKQDNR